jgi:hypothetical protein
MANACVLVKGLVLGVLLCGLSTGNDPTVSAGSPKAIQKQGQAARPHLQDAIRHCHRVAKLGDQVDPGASLNPAVKAGAAAREAQKHLRAMTDSGA